MCEQELRIYLSLQNAKRFRTSTTSKIRLNDSCSMLLELHKLWRMREANKLIKYQPHYLNSMTMVINCAGFMRFYFYGVSLSDILALSLSLSCSLCGRATAWELPHDSL